LKKVHAGSSITQNRQSLDSYLKQFEKSVMAIYSLRVWDLTKERSGKGKNNKYLSRFTGLR